MPVRFIQLINRTQKQWALKHLPRTIYVDGQLGNKLKSHFVLKELGFPVTKILGTQLTREQAVEKVEAVGKGFIKPQHSMASRGCMGLKKVNGQFQNVLTGDLYTREQLLAWLERWDDRYDFVGTWIVEELLEGVGQPLPRDIKFYCFGDSIRLISIMERVWDPEEQRLSLNMQWFSNRWKPLEMPAAHSDRIDTSIEPPSLSHVRPYMDMALDVARKILLPFMRVDTYETTRGPVMGELTPDPSSAAYFEPIWHERFVHEWRLTRPKIEAFLKTSEGRRLLEQHQRIARRWDARATVLRPT